MRQKKKYLYHRVSTKEQHLDRGVIELEEYSRKHDLKNTEMYLDKFTGKNYDRPEYTKMRKKIMTGDVLIVTEIDRFGRNKEEILSELKYFKNKSIQVQILEIPTTLINVDRLDSEMAKLMIDTVSNMLIELYATFAQAEMEKRVKRQREGIEAKKARGEWDDYGRPRKVEREEFERVYQNYTPQEFMKKYDISIYTYRNYMKELEEKKKKENMIKET